MSSVTVCPYCGDVVSSLHLRSHLSFCKGKSPPKNGIEYYKYLNEQQKSSTRERGSASTSYMEEAIRGPVGFYQGVQEELYSPLPRKPSESVPSSSSKTTAPSMKGSASHPGSTSGSRVLASSIPQVKFGRSDNEPKVLGSLSQPKASEAGIATKRFGTTPSQSIPVDVTPSMSHRGPTEDLRSLREESAVVPRSKLSRVMQGKASLSTDMRYSSAPTERENETEEMNYVLQGTINAHEMELAALKAQQQQLAERLGAVQSVAAIGKDLDIFKRATNTSIDHLERRCDALDRELAGVKMSLLKERPTDVSTTSQTSSKIRIVHQSSTAKDLHGGVDPDRTNHSHQLDPHNRTRNTQMENPSFLEKSLDARTIISLLNGPSVMAESPWRPLYTSFV
ncbi:hypothetical protein ADEAN_000066900 [Angomonas deanei]|uniref:Uncharacterized protein n=1 Tax=Angomonas deanei TaxID=59799 RepID=A0A7G2C5L6_9TRYP|nr:hypothetical protein ADEAN_000066900 [Angomonas deanei]